MSQKVSWYRFHRRLITHLGYFNLSPLVFILYKLVHFETNLVMKNRVLDDIYKPMVNISLFNHSFQLDAAILFLFAEQFGKYEAYKGFAKYELKFIPVLGWVAAQMGFIFVQRNWTTDKENVKRHIKEACNLNSVFFLIFPEATRWTIEKHIDSVNFCKQRNMQPFSYHLTPRPRGFVFTLRQLLRMSDENMHVNGKPLRLWNFQLGFRNDVKLADLLNDKKLILDIYVEEVELKSEIRAEALKSVDEDDCPLMTKFLMEIFRRKDEIQHRYYKCSQRHVVLDDETEQKFDFKPARTATFCWTICMLVTFAFTVALTIWFKLTSVFTLIFSSLFMLAVGNFIFNRFEREATAQNLFLKAKQKILSESKSKS